MAKINDYFLKAIFSEKDIDVTENSVSMAIRAMARFAEPELHQDNYGDYNLYYTVPFNKIKDSDMDEGDAFELRQYGWILDKSEENIIKQL